MASGFQSHGGCLVIPSISILVVDDYEPWRQRICSILQTRPELRVIAEVGDGLAAAQIADKLKPDLILLDIGKRFQGVSKAMASSRLFMKP